MKRINYLLMILLSLFVLVSCGDINSNGNTNSISNSSTNAVGTSSSEGNINDSLKLLSFEEVEDVYYSVGACDEIISYTSIGEEVLEVNDYSITVCATVKNDNRDSFIDIVIYNSITNKEAVYNEGNGNYVCSSTTERQNGIWVTLIEIEIDLDWEIDDNNTVPIEYLEVEEIQFLHNSSNTNAQVDSNVNRLTMKPGDWIVEALLSSANPICIDENLPDLLFEVYITRGHVVLAVTGDSYTESELTFTIPESVYVYTCEDSVITRELVELDDLIIRVGLNSVTKYNITVPSITEVLGCEAFKKQASPIFELNLPKSVTSFYEYYCDGFETIINYAGTKSEFKSIKKSSTRLNDLEITLKCSDGTFNKYKDCDN